MSGLTTPGQSSQIGTRSLKILSAICTVGFRTVTSVGCLLWLTVICLSKPPKRNKNEDFAFQLFFPRYTDFPHCTYLSSILVCTIYCIRDNVLHEKFRVLLLFSRLESLLRVLMCLCFAYNASAVFPFRLIIG